MNSLKSVCSSPKGTPVSFDQIQQNVDAFLRAQAPIADVFCVFGILETIENPARLFHVPVSLIGRACPGSTTDCVRGVVTSPIIRDGVSESDRFRGTTYPRLWGVDGSPQPTFPP